MHTLFEKGCLVQLSASVWGATRKIQSAHTAKMGAAPEWLTANKKLVDPDALKPLRKTVNAARSYLDRVSLPFPIPTMVFVPKEMITTIDEELNRFKSSFSEKVEDFQAEYHQLREMARIHLGALFNDTDYPADINSRFSFAWRFVTLDVPNGNTRLLAPEVYEREKEKFIQTMEEAREMAIQALREEFANLVTRITDRFEKDSAGKRKIFKNGTVNNFYEYFETFKQRNIFNDTALSELVEQAQSLLSGHSAESIRSNEILKEDIRSGMETIEQGLEELMELPRRRILMN